MSHGVFGETSVIRHSVFVRGHRGDGGMPETEQTSPRETESGGSNQSPRPWERCRMIFSAAGAAAWRPTRFGCDAAAVSPTHTTAVQEEV